MSKKQSLDDLLYEIRRVEQSREILTEKKIKAIYKSLEKDLDGFLGGEYKKYADKDGRFYMSYLEAQNKRASFLNEIVKNVDGISPQLKKEMSTLVDETYKQTYKGMLEAVKKAETRAEFERIVKDISVQPDVLKQAVNNNISKLTLPQVMEKHRAEIIYQIQQEINIGLMNGDRYEQMARRVSNVLVGNGYKGTKGLQGKSMNIVRTESHRNIESGFLDCAERIQQGLEGSEYICAVTWKTMQDERVRPQVRRHTSKGGWKTTLSRSGANHMRMDGQTIKAGEYFDLGDGNKTKAPSQSGVAAHDCNCRCYLSHKTMTVEEFASATGQTVEQVRKKYNIKTPVKEKYLTDDDKKSIITAKKEENVKLDINNFPAVLTKGAEGKNTQKLIDYVNNIEGADPKVLKLYASTGKLENLNSNGITFKVSHAKGHCVQTTSNGITGELKEVKYTIPKLKGENIAGQVNTTLHEQMHLIDLFGREDVAKRGKWHSTTNKKLVNAVKNTSDDMSDEISDIFVRFNKEYKSVRTAVNREYQDKINSVKKEYMGDKSPWEDIHAYKRYEKEAKKLQKEMAEEIDYQSRNIMGGGVNNLQDIYDAFSDGKYRADGIVTYGHGQRYYASTENQVLETIANYASLSVTRPDLIDMLRRDKPDLCKALDEVIEELLEKAGA